MDHVQKSNIIQNLLHLLGILKKQVEDFEHQIKKSEVVMGYLPDSPERHQLQSWHLVNSSRIDRFKSDIAQSELILHNQHLVPLRADLSYLDKINESIFNQLNMYSEGHQNLSDTICDYIQNNHFFLAQHAHYGWSTSRSLKETGVIIAATGASVQLIIDFCQSDDQSKDAYVLVFGVAVMLFTYAACLAALCNAYPKFPHWFGAGYGAVKTLFQNRCPDSSPDPIQGMQAKQGLPSFRVSSV